MNGIVINIDPTIFHLDAFELRWYSLAIVTAILAAILITTHYGKKKGIAEGEISTLALFTVISGLLGARLFHAPVCKKAFDEKPKKYIKEKSERDQCCVC